MKLGVVVFPGSNCDHDLYHVLKHVLQQEVRFIWHKETNLSGLDGIFLAGGFSYGDYLRSGAIARFSPVMNEVVEFARKGRLVMGICNGFQVLCESHLLPGALMRNKNLDFVCKQVYIRVETNRSRFTQACAKNQVLKMPIAHGEGNYYAAPETIAELESGNRILFRYSMKNGEITERANPNGSMGNIAGICNESGNVMGMMPHPERAAEAVLGSEDGKQIFASLLQTAIDAR